MGVQFSTAVILYSTLRSLLNHERLNMPVKQLNKSDEVRKLYKNGVKSASEIGAKLKTRGIEVAPSQIYQIIAKLKGKKPKSKPSKPTASHSSKHETVIDSAVVFVRQAGGMSKARELLSKLALLQQ